MPQKRISPAVHKLKTTLCTTWLSSNELSSCICVQHNNVASGIHYTAEILKHSSLKLKLRYTATHHYDNTSLYAQMYA